jgi:hypothetical protein
LTTRQRPFRLADLPGVGYLLAPWSLLSDLRTAIVRHGIRISRLEHWMATTDELVARFAAATDEIASDLEALRGEVALLDAGVAAKFEPLVARLEGLGADPANPVPEPA